MGLTGHSLVVPELHVVNVCFGDEFVQQGVPLFVRNLVLNCDEHVLQVHDSIVELHGILRHVCLLPSRLNQFLLSLNLGL